MSIWKKLFGSFSSESPASCPTTTPKDAEVASNRLMAVRSEMAALKESIDDLLVSKARSAGTVVLETQLKEAKAAAAKAGLSKEALQAKQAEVKRLEADIAELGKFFSESAAPPNPALLAYAERVYALKQAKDEAYDAEIALLNTRRGFSDYAKSNYAKVRARKVKADAHFAQADLDLRNAQLERAKIPDAPDAWVIMLTCLNEAVTRAEALAKSTYERAQTHDRSLEIETEIIREQIKLKPAHGNKPKDAEKDDIEKKIIELKGEKKDLDTLIEKNAGFSKSERLKESSDPLKQLDGSSLDLAQQKYQKESEIERIDGIVGALKREFRSKEAPEAKLEIDKQIQELETRKTVLEGEVEDLKGRADAVAQERQAQTSTTKCSRCGSDGSSSPIGLVPVTVEGPGGKQKEVQMCFDCFGKSMSEANSVRIG